MRLAVVMGVAGSGKTSVGRALAERLEAAWIDGDDLHSTRSVARMAAGIPLDDADRAPWLDRVATALREAPGPTLVGCSALRRAYRDRIRARAGAPVAFVHLVGLRDLIAARMAARQGHFMPPSLLDSQFAALEPLAGDEAGLVLDISRPLDALVAEAARTLEEVQAWDSTSR